MSGTNQPPKNGLAATAGIIRAAIHPRPSVHPSIRQPAEGSSRSFQERHFPLLREVPKGLDLPWDLDSPWLVDGAESYPPRRHRSCPGPTAAPPDQIACGALRLLGSFIRTRMASGPWLQKQLLKLLVSGSSSSTENGRTVCHLAPRLEHH